MSFVSAPLAVRRLPSGVCFGPQSGLSSDVDLPGGHGRSSGGGSGFGAFVDLVRPHIPGWRWVAVPEIQEKRAARTGKRVWHWHMAVSGWQDVRLLRSLWRRVVGEGNIDVRSPRSGGRARWGRLRLSYYLVKYIYKSVENVELGEHRYYRSREVGGDFVLRERFGSFQKLMSWVQDIFAAWACA